MHFTTTKNLKKPKKNQENQLRKEHHSLKNEFLDKQVNLFKYFICTLFPLIFCFNFFFYF